jgi:hypothetical protein
MTPNGTSFALAAAAFAQCGPKGLYFLAATYPIQLSVHQPEC